MGIKPGFRDDDVAIIEVNGEFDASNLPGFRIKVDGVLQQGIRKVVLDLRDLRFADSKMLGQLLRVQQGLRENGGDVVLLRPGRFVMRAIEVLGLDACFTICRTQTEALRAFAPRAMENGVGAPDSEPEKVWRITRVS